MAKRTGLGRGISALIPTADQAERPVDVFFPGASIQKVEEAEQELWELTASDTPDADAVESKVREIEKLRGDQRLQFIRAVGEAAKVLSEEQRQVLVGAAGASHTKH